MITQNPTWFERMEREECLTNKMRHDVMVNPFLAGENATFSHLLSLPSLFDYVAVSFIEGVGRVVVEG